MKKNYTIISALSGEGYKYIRNLQKKLFEITGSTKCLFDRVPHITVGDGVVLNKEELEHTKATIDQICDSQEKIKIRLSGFGGTDNRRGVIDGVVTPYVLWLNIENSSKLFELHHQIKQEIIEGLDTRLPRTTQFNPHITLAFADLSEQGYVDGLKYLRSLDLTIELEINNVCVYECYGEGNMCSVENYRQHLTGESTINL